MKSEKYSFYIMIKIKNQRSGGYLFHYAHFICDCLFPEIINDIYKYKIVIREKNLDQTIGNFNEFYNTIMRTENRELLKKDFDALTERLTILPTRNHYCNKIHFEKFRNYIFSIYNIDKHSYNINYPSVILVKRDVRKELIDDDYLSKLNNSIITKKEIRISTGKERREINNISKLENYLQNKYSDKFKSLYFENISFEEQVRNFNNAKLIMYQEISKHPRPYFEVNELIVKQLINSESFFARKFDKNSNILDFKDQLLAS